MKRVIAAFTVLMLIGTAGCNSKETDANTQITATAVSTTPAKTGTITSTMSFNGNLKAESEVVVTIPQPGKVISSKVGVGTAVKKGDLLFSMDSTGVDAQKGATQAQYDAAKASADYTNTMIADTKKQLSSTKNAITTLDKQIKSLIKPVEAALTGNTAQSSIISKLNGGNYSQAVDEIKNLKLSGAVFDNLENLVLSWQQLNSVITQLESSLKTLQGQKIQTDGQVNAAKESIKAIEAQINNYKVYAPISGIISTYNITVGSYPASQIPLTIVNMDKLTLTVNMLDTQIGKVKVGDNVELSIEAMDNKKVTGVVTSVAPSPDLQTNMYPVVVEIKNNGHEIKPGYFVNASFFISKKENTLYIPASSLLINDDGSKYVYINSGGTAKKVSVETGIEDAYGNAEVISGINEGDLVITTNLTSLRDGAPVFSLEGMEESK